MAEDIYDDRQEVSDFIDSCKAPFKTEDGDIDLDHPLVMSFRRINLEKAAKEQESDLYCPTCEINLPYTQMTVVQVADGVDANFNKVYKPQYFCTLCEEYFDKE